MQKYTLTDEHRAQLKPWAQQWIANAMRTAPMTEEERKGCVRAVRELYRLAGKPAPKAVVFVPSPFVLRFASGFAAAIWSLRKKSAATNEATDAATYAATLAATNAATDAATNDATNDATYAATLAATYAATYAATRAATDAATYAATRDATRDAIDAATNDATRDATDAATYAATLAATYDAFKQKIKPNDLNYWYAMNGNPAVLDRAFRLNGFGLKCSDSIWNCYQGGNFWSAWDSFLSFFRHVVKLPLDYTKYEPWEYLARHSSVRIVHKDFCMICDFPTRLMVDSENRPHCADGPFCQWSDGSALYAFHGVRVPAWVIESTEKITVDTISREQNVEVKRVMIAKYGQSRYLIDSDAEEIHRDDFGTLYRSAVANDEPIVMVKVVNSTPEADGSFKDYFLRVPPTIKTAREAVAWSFDMPESDYAPSQQT